MPHAPRRYTPHGFKRGRAEARPSSTQRGYDHKWRELRKAKIHHNPWCENCERNGMQHVPAEEVDHIIPFKSKDDPRRMDWRNVQSLCGTCHKRKTIRDRQAGLTRRYE